MSETRQQKDGLSVQTLVIASLSSLAAAVVIGQVWRPGTLFAAAMTPVIVTLTQELLKKPVQTVSAVRVPRPARAPARPAARGSVAAETAVQPTPAPEATVPDEVARRREQDRFGVWSEPRPSRRRRNVGLALATGLIAFAVAAFALTGAEAVFGGAAGGNDDQFTLWGGEDRDRGSRSRDEAPATTTESPSEAAPAPEEEAETPPAQTAPAPAPEAPAEEPPATTPPAEEPAPAPGPQRAPGGTEAPAQPVPDG